MSFPDTTVKIFAKYKGQVILVKDAIDSQIATDNRDAAMSLLFFIQQRL